MENINFPMPPSNQYPSQPNYTQQVGGYNTEPTQADTFIPTFEADVPSQYHGLGASFNNLIGRSVPVVGDLSTINTENVEKNKKKKSSSTAVVKSSKKEVSEPVNSKDIVENTIYADTFVDTNNMAYGVIAQADELLNNAKQELDYIRGRNIKGKYIYMNNMLSSMSSLMSTKLQAIREINNNIKNANDMEYRRFKDNRSLETEDDNKTIMDAYRAFISAPVGAPTANIPNTLDMTAGINGIIKADNSNSTQDAALNHYMSNLTPEENLMLHDNNPDIEEVIVYDQATGAKYFQWMNTRTREFINNMPIDSNLVLEDFVIDPRTRLAKNTNLNMIKKVIYLNEGKFDEY